VLERRDTSKGVVWGLPPGRVDVSDADADSDAGSDHPS